MQTFRSKFVFLFTQGLVLSVVLGCQSRGEPTLVGLEFDPTSWGGDHVGEEHPDYVTGDACLFCHRVGVGPTWAANRHHRTLRLVDADLKEELEGLEGIGQEVTLQLGGRDTTIRFLKPIGYGRLAILNTTWTSMASDGGGWMTAEAPSFEESKFERACAGCHTTGHDSTTRRFASPSLDCYVCHGNVGAEHTGDPARVFLSPRAQDPARVVISICGQCHIRTGISRSTGFPFANNFVPGDNLFRDLAVDFTVSSSLSVIDRHVLENVRVVVIEGREDLTCLTCHTVHAQSSREHRRVREGAYCWNCHFEGEPKSSYRPLTRQSKTCETKRL